MKMRSTRTEIAGLAGGILISGIFGIISAASDVYPIIPWSALVATAIIILWSTVKYPINKEEKKLIDHEARLKMLEHRLSSREPNEASTHR